MIYKNEYENCIHFDGKECRNEESCNYGSYGEFCVDCKDVEGDDNMKKIEIIECLGLDADGFEVYEAKINEINTYIIISFKDINKPKINVDIDKTQEVDKYLMKLGYYSEVLYFNMSVLQSCDAYTIDIHLKNDGCMWLKNIILEYNKSNIQKQVIKQEIKFIKKVIEEINKISKETDDEIWDAGLIETTFEVYITLEKECKKILNELNINFNMSEYTPTESIPKAIELIEKEIL